MQTVFSHRVLDCEDESASGYIGYITEHPAAASPAAMSVNTGAAQINDAAASPDKPAASQKAASDVKTIGDIIVSGNKSLIEAKTTELLLSRDVMDIINNEFIPALDRVGELYEAGKIFLPQLMNSAETAKKGFEVIKKASSQGNSSKRMSIVLATVKGDIHDIGKNIVKMLLENYGYDVIDLGKDVDPQLIVDTVKEKNIHLVGLSALMTTTVHNMEDTIDLLKKECPGVKIMVGGAVLSETLANKIGADYYSKDAAGSAKIAAEVENSL
jgi:5-methyltetrahydrofolate--homocysteine methyltransferase